MKIIAFLLPFLCYLSTAQAQLPGACGGGSSPAVSCDEACINCNFNGYTGSTAGFPSGFALQFCGTVENAQWLGFIAGQANATFTIQPFNCLNGNGVQVALYSDCSAPPLACDKGQMDGGMLPVTISADLAPGGNYFLLIDGYAGDLCDFTVTVTPDDAVYQPPLGDIQQVLGPTALCPGATFEYIVPPVFGAGAYIWEGPPGTLFDSMPSPATILGEKGRKVQVTMGTESGNICVVAANSCSQTPACASSIFVQALPDSERPVLDKDSVQHLNCSSAPLELELSVSPQADYTYTWSSDSSGHLVSGKDQLKPRVNQTGMYFLYVRNQVNGCARTDSIRVAPPALPDSAVLDIRHITCFGDENGILKIDSIYGGKAPFLYAVDQQSLVFFQQYTGLAPGPHSLTVEGANGCRWDTVFTIVEPLKLAVDAGSEISIPLGNTLVFTQDMQVSEPDRVDKIRIDPPELSAFLCDTCHFCPQNTFRYTLTIADSNGCLASDDRVVVVDKHRRVYFPNVFNPDEEDGNERFLLSCGQDVQRIRSLRIYNRWGQLMFEQVNAAPNDPESAWDGRIGNDLQPPGVFLYVAEIEFKDGAREVFRGDVTLIR
jgi:hypothetical protein